MRGRLEFARFASCAAALSAAVLFVGCFFGLADVVPASDAGGNDASAGDDASLDGAVGDDASSDASSDAGSDADANHPGSFTFLGQACPQGTPVTSIAFASGKIFAVCGSGKIDAGSLGALVVAPSVGAAFATPPGGGVGEAVTTLAGVAYYHATCGLARQATGNEVTLTPIAPTTVTFASAVSGVLYFASTTDLYFDQPSSACGADAGCTADLGCTTSVGPVQDTPIGVAPFSGSSYATFCGGGALTLRAYPSGSSTGTLPAAAYTDSASTCDATKPGGAAAVGSDLYFGDGRIVKHAHFAGKNFKVDDLTTEPDPVRAVTSDGTNLAWLSGSRVRGGAQIATTLATPPAPPTAIDVASGVVYFGTADGAVAKIP